MIRAALIVVVLTATPADALTLDYVYCRLYPSKCLVGQPAEPVRAPVAVVPAPVPPVKHNAVKAKVNRKTIIKHQRKVTDTGPDLPWPCWQVRISGMGKTTAELKTEGARRGIKLSAKQERQALACLGRG